MFVGLVSGDLTVGIVFVSLSPFLSHRSLGLLVFDNLLNRREIKLFNVLWCCLLCFLTFKCIVVGFMCVFLCWTLRVELRGAGLPLVLAVRPLNHPV